MYCNTNFIRDLKNCQPTDYDSLRSGPETDQKRKYEKIMKDFAEHEIVLIPFYPDPTPEDDDELTPMLVELHPR